MGETTDAIRSQIDDQRHQLEENLEGIEGKLKGASDQVQDKVQETKDQVQAKVKEATDWKMQFDKRPMMSIGVAFGGGVLLASLMGGGKKEGKSSNQNYPPPYQGYAPTYQSYAGGGPSGADIGRQQASSTIDNIKGALMGVAAAKAKDYLSGAMPEFKDEYRQVETKRDEEKPENDSAPPSTSYGVQDPERSDAQAS